MIHQVTNIFSYLNRELKLRYCSVVLMSIFSPVLDMFSLSMLFPILNQVAAGGSEQEAVLKLLFLSVLMVFKGFYDLLLTKIQSSWQCDCNQILATRMFDLMLQEDLVRHNSKNESQALHNVRQDVGVTVMILVYFKELILNGLLLGGYTILLFMMTGVVGVISVLFLGIVMLSLRSWKKKKILSYGSKVRQKEIELANMTVSSFHAFKEVAMDERKANLTAEFSEASKKKEAITKTYLLHQSVMAVIMQNLTNASIFALLAIIMMTDFDISKLVSMVVLLVTVLAKMIPAAKNVLVNLNAANYADKACKSTVDNCRQYEEILKEQELSEVYRYRPLSLKKAVRVERLTFAYPDGPVVLEHVNMEIPAGSTVALVGASGKGKTTLLDLIAGLLKPLDGKILYDDYDIVKNQDGVEKCRTNIGKIVSYMPQAPVFYEGSVKECVSFMENPDSVDEVRVAECLKTAMLYEDIQKLPHGLDTVIGANGVRLSGGQYQRLGLARALYKDFELLIMDEGTASLDSDIETAIFHAVRQAHKGKTLLVSTHHRDLAELCDLVYEIKENHIIRRK